MSNEDSTPAETVLWIEQAKQGDRSALGRLLDAFRPVLRARTRESLDAGIRARVDESDVVQQTCLSAYRAIGKFRGDTEPEFLQWLLRILERNLLNVVEHEKGAAKRDINREVAGSEHLRQAPGRDTSAGGKAIRDEHREILQAAIDQLPEDQREAVQIKYFEHATLSETALRLGKTEDAVSGLLRRGIFQLNTILRDQGFTEP